MASHSRPRAALGLAERLTPKALPAAPSLLGSPCGR